MAEQCFICERTSGELALVKLPVEFKWGEIHFEVMGNCKPDEFICLPCLGYQYDFARIEKNVSNVN